jgi:hypothetical protein
MSRRARRNGRRDHTGLERPGRSSPSWLYRRTKAPRSSAPSRFRRSRKGAANICAATCLPRWRRLETRGGGGVRSTRHTAYPQNPRQQQGSAAVISALPPSAISTGRGSGPDLTGDREA